MKIKTGKVKLFRSKRDKADYRFAEDVADAEKLEVECMCGDKYGNHSVMESHSCTKCSCKRFRSLNQKHKPKFTSKDFWGSRLSKAGREAISKAQKARWAKKKKTSVRTPVRRFEFCDKNRIWTNVTPEVSASSQSETSSVRFPLASVIRKAMESVNHPHHYGGDTTYEVIKVLEAWGLDKSFCLGNSVKYIARAKQKTPTLKGIIEDLEKAAWYLNREIINLKAVQAKISGVVK